MHRFKRALELLPYDGLYAGIELPLPSDVRTPPFPGSCVGRYRRLAPLQEWLVDSTGI